MITHKAIAARFKAGESVSAIVSEIRQDSFNQRGRRMWTKKATAVVETAIRQVLRRKGSGGVR